MPPAVGKTFTAKRLATRLGLPWISTDTIRDMMKEIVDPKEYPRLKPREKKAETYLKKYSPAQIVKKQNQESISVWRGVAALIKTDCNWRSFIIEGVAILPGLIHKTFSKNNAIKPVFLINENKKQIKKVVYNRGLWDDAHTYSDDVKEVEVKWAYLFNNWLEKEAKKYGYPVYRIKKWNFPISDITKLVK